MTEFCCKSTWPWTCFSWMFFFFFFWVIEIVGTSAWPRVVGLLTVGYSSSPSCLQFHLFQIVWTVLFLLSYLFITYLPIVVAPAVAVAVSGPESWQASEWPSLPLLCDRATSRLLPVYSLPGCMAVGRSLSLPAPQMAVGGTLDVLLLLHCVELFGLVADGPLCAYGLPGLCGGRQVSWRFELFMVSTFPVFFSIFILSRSSTLSLSPDVLSSS